jgi:hypothetical protein
VPTLFALTLAACGGGDGASTTGVTATATTGAGGATTGAAGGASSGGAAHGGGGGVASSGGSGGATSTSAGGGGGATTTTGAGGSGGATTTTSAGGGGAAATWSAPIERCDGVDDDGDGVADEDCAPSLWGGAFPPGGGADLAGAGTIARLEKDSGRAVSVVQTYHGTKPAGAAKIAPDLDAIWAHGATPHLNLEPSGYAAAQYANAGADAALGADLEAVAGAIAGSLAAHPGKRLLATFGAEMNGNWTDWGCLAPATFVAFYRRMHDLASAALASASPPVDARRLRWVYGPNSTSSQGCGSAAAYYPGHAYADYLGMSAYRSGAQGVAAAVTTPAHALVAALGLPAAWSADRFVVLQTGSRVVQGDDRGAWVTSLYGALAADPIFLGVIWFDAQDWALLDANAAPLPGYDAWVAATKALPTASPALDGTFEPFFWDVGVAHERYAEIQSLRAAGLTSGCASSPPTFCPDDALSRAAAAIFLARAFGIALDAGGPALFGDLAPGAAGYGEAQALAKLGALAGCTPSSFCPKDAITRGDLAAALDVLSKPPAGPAGAFGDLPAGEPRTAAIEALAALGRVDGCGPGAFCRGDAAKRGDGAAWIVRSAMVPPAPKL